jgi:tRNA-specific 2-thiouridylase
VGEHNGAMFYTIGERAGNIVDNLRYRLVRAETQVPPTYIVSKNVAENTLYVSEDHNDRHMFTSTVVINEVCLTGAPKDYDISTLDTSKETPENIFCQIRYQQAPVAVKFVHYQEGKIIVETQEPLWAVAEGQSLVLYENDRVVAGGVVCATR